VATSENAARGGRRVERIRGTIDVPIVMRKPFGPGWALVGEPGLVMDPITAQGINDAFRDAELLADAMVAGYGRPMQEALGAHQATRDEAVLPTNDFTLGVAASGPTRMDSRGAFSALAAGPQSERDLHRRHRRRHPTSRVHDDGQPAADRMRGLARLIFGTMRERRSAAAVL
jgi:flavin-dependent dehydrogenase